MEAIDRVVKIVAYLATCPQGISANELSKECGIPFTTLKDDLRIIQRSYPVYTEPDDFDREEDAYGPDVKWILVEGHRPYLPVQMTMPEAAGLLNVLEICWRQ